MTKYLTILLASSALAVSPAMAQPVVPVQETLGQPVTETETDRLNTWFDAKFEEQLATSPITQTFLGRKTGYDEIDDFSEAAADRDLKWMQDATAEMKRSFDYDKLSPDAKISWAMWLHNLKQAEAAVPYRKNNYVLHQFNGTQSFFQHS